MDTETIWDYLSGLPVGTIVSWIVVVCAIVAAICFGAIKLYKVFSKYSKIKADDEKQKEIIKEHDDVLKGVKLSLDCIKTSLDEQREINLRQIRYSIVHTCDEALSAGHISAGKLKSLEELYDEYDHVFHANGYARTMVIKTRELPVVGKLDE